MADNPVLLDTTTSTSAVTSLTSGSISPSANALLMIFGAPARANTTFVFGVATDTLSGTGVWTRNAELSAENSNILGLAVWTAQCGPAPGSGTVTINWTGNANVNIMHVIEVADGFNTSAPITQTKTGNGTSATPSLTLDSSPDANGLVVGVVTSRNDGDTAITPGAQFTEIVDATVTGAITVTEQAQYDNTTPGTTVDWSGAGTSNNGFLAIEIASAAVAGDGFAPFGNLKKRRFQPLIVR